MRMSDRETMHRVRKGACEVTNYVIVDPLFQEEESGRMIGAIPVGGE
jgi:hypothetical protein